jgi:hypothetical protein
LVVVVVGLVLRIIGSPPSTQTVTVSIAQVNAQPEARLTYPHAVLLATEVLTGTTVMNAQYSTSGSGRYRSTYVSGYSSTAVHGGEMRRLFTTRDSLSRVLPWYHDTLTSRGWSAYPVRSSTNPDITGASYGSTVGSPDTGPPETFVIYGGDPEAVTLLGSGLDNPPPSHDTLFATVYTMYPAGTTLLPQ